MRMYYAIQENYIIKYEDFVQERFDVIRKHSGLNLAVHEQSEFIKLIRFDFHKVVYDKEVSRVLKDYMFDQSYQYMSKFVNESITEIWYPAPHLAWFKYPM